MANVSVSELDTSTKIVDDDKTTNEYFESIWHEVVHAVEQINANKALIDSLHP